MDGVGHPLGVIIPNITPVPLIIWIILHIALPIPSFLDPVIRFHWTVTFGGIEFGTACGGYNRECLLEAYNNIAGLEVATDVTHIRQELKISSAGHKASVPSTLREKNRSRRNMCKDMS